MSSQNPLSKPSNQPFSPLFPTRDWLAKAMPTRRERLGADWPMVRLFTRAVVVARTLYQPVAWWLARVIPALCRLAMWASIALACTVVGAYALLCPRDALPQHMFQIGPDPDFRPIPAPVGPLPPDAEQIASAR